MEALARDRRGPSDLAVDREEEVATERHLYK